MSEVCTGNRLLVLRSEPAMSLQYMVISRRKKSRQTVAQGRTKVVILLIGWEPQPRAGAPVPGHPLPV
jgi:hypothetical protein